MPQTPAMRRIHAIAKAAGIDPPHDYLHEWAVSCHKNSLSDFTDAELDTMNNRIEADPIGMAAWFDQFEPMEWEQMDPTENAEPGDVSALRHLFTPEQEADLHAAADRIQRADRYRD